MALKSKSVESQLNKAMEELKRFAAGEGELFAELGPQYMAARRNAYNMLSPANNPAMIERFRNSALASANMVAAQGKANALWGGYGGDSTANTAYMQAVGQTGDFARQLYSPEYITSQLNALRGIVSPDMINTYYQTKGLKKQVQPPKQSGGFLGGILGPIGQMAANFLPMGQPQAPRPTYLGSDASTYSPNQSVVTW